jgi:hypothetical protein
MITQTTIEDTQHFKISNQKYQAESETGQTHEWKW